MPDSRSVTMYSEPDILYKIFLSSYSFLWGVSPPRLLHYLILFNWIIIRAFKNCYNIIASISNLICPFPSSAHAAKPSRIKCSVIFRKNNHDLIIHSVHRHPLLMAAHNIHKSNDYIVFSYHPPTSKCQFRTHNKHYFLCSRTFGILLF